MPPSTPAIATAITDGSNGISADQQGDENHPAARHGDPSNQDEFAAALDPVGELIDLSLEPHDFVARILTIHMKLL